MPENDNLNPVMEPEDIMAELRRRIERQATMIRVAIGYLNAQQPELARQVLEGTFPA